MLKAGVNPEISQWDVVLSQAEIAEIAENITTEPRGRREPSTSQFVNPSGRKSGLLATRNGWKRRAARPFFRRERFSQVLLLAQGNNMRARQANANAQNRKTGDSRRSKLPRQGKKPEDRLSLGAITWYSYQEDPETDQSWRLTYPYSVTEEEIDWQIATE